jgi:hypothetical protein
MAKQPKKSSWGGARPNSGPKNRPALRAEPKVRTLVPAEPRTMSPETLRELAFASAAIAARYSKTARTQENNPFKLPDFPAEAIPPKELGGGMAMDSNLTASLKFSSDGWLAGSILGGLSGEGLQFLGYTYLSQLAQQPEYRIMGETIADDATREWIDFDVTGDEKEEAEQKAKDPESYEERMADPDERKKRVEQAGKTDKVKQLEDDQLRLEVRDRFYEQSRNDNFFGRSHLFLDIRTTDTSEIDQKELEADIGDSRSELSRTKVPKGSFKGLRTIEPIWTYPLMYNAINPLRKDWYCPQVWYVMGQQIHGSRLQTFSGHPVPDMLKPAYAFGGISLSQMAKPYVDRWLTTVTSVNDLIKAFSVMIFMTDLAPTSQPGATAALDARMAMFTMFRDNMGVFVGNKNTEDLKNISAPLSGLHELQAQSQEHMASVNRIPLVKFTGIQPSGLNASSEGEIEVYDDTIAAYQKRFMDANLRRVVNFEMLSLWGEIDPEITHRWCKLRPMTQAEKGQKEKDDADRDQKYVDMGVLAPAEVRTRIINDKDLPYTALNPEDVPDLQQEEEAGLEPQGGRPDPKAGGDDPFPEIEP